MDFDPSPLFALSLLPYLLFLRWLKRSETLPDLALWGFRLTLLFVLMTIGAAVLALRCCDAELVAVDVKVRLAKARVGPICLPVSVAWR